MLRLLATSAALAAMAKAQGEQVVLANDPVTVRVERVGFSNARLQEAVTQALNTGQVLGALNDTRYRVLRVDFQGSDELGGAGCSGKSAGTAEAFQAQVFDYTNGRVVSIIGDAFSPASSVMIGESGHQPLPSVDEVAEAARIAGFSEKAVAYAAMPPLVDRVFANGTSHRVLHILAREPDEDSARSTELYVNLSNRTVETPATASRMTAQRTESAPVCDASPDSGAHVTPRGTPGVAQITILQGATVLWTMQVTRPAASSGGMGSGIELHAVRYRDRSVLYKAHVPILNVEYKQPGTGCGPTYRDWQNEEYGFNCPGSDVPGVPGFRVCTSPPTTIVDPPYVDGGSYNGVAVYVSGTTIVLRSQLRAGWYRYTSEWRFAADGTVTPRWGFGGVWWPGSGCICVPHHHHVYWRLDFDIETAGGNRVREFNPNMSGPPNLGTLADVVYEVQRPRSPARHWEVSNTQTGRTYALYPGTNDGASDAFGVGDLWVLRYNGGQIDDGAVPDNAAHISKFTNAESVVDTDVVLWYAAHFLHDEQHPHGSHIVGPTIKPLGTWQ
ncbi:copper amine oxidase [Lasiosphaeria ovina]|uniref:Copper amine oxidase n=1 Tax=Lasiosphaeria ovina TaxID=92902 RepID=A0AAE0KB71_9PEZI|nr:copper amine oxidase [Lasiosphaeria ovina]